LDLDRPVGSWQRYGADPNGLRDSTAAIQAAVRTGGAAFDEAGGTYLVSGPIDVGPNVTVSGVPGRTELACTNPDASLFRVHGPQGATVESIRFRIARSSAKAYTAPVHFMGAVGGVCRDCEFIGCSWAGVLLQDTSSATVTGCHFHGFLGSVQDSADICLYGLARDNTVSGNHCEGGNDHGILLEDPYSGKLPVGNLVADNRISGHRAYGICLYLPSPGDTDNRISENVIEDIRGVSFDGASGPGIYVAGLGAGGTRIEGNTLRRCCLETSNRTESPGAIGLHGMSARNAPLRIAGNVIEDVSRYDGILVSVNEAQVVLSDNVVKLAAGNAAGTPIRIEDASNVHVEGNTLLRPADVGGCVFVYANATTVGDITVVANSCSGGAGMQLRFESSAGGRIERLECSENACSDGGVDAIGLALIGVAGTRVAGNRCEGRSAPTLYLRDVRDVRLADNQLASEGSCSVLIEGDCRGSVYAASNVQTGGIVDRGSGMEFE
jgi:hypothetical protein